jgi:hypothetical protein
MTKNRYDVLWVKAQYYTKKLHKYRTQKGHDAALRLVQKHSYYTIDEKIAVLDRILRFIHYFNKKEVTQ